jgi:hypothetical protein
MTKWVEWEGEGNCNQRRTSGACRSRREKDDVVGIKGHSEARRGERNKRSNYGNHPKTNY